jgi:transposase
MSGSRKHYSSTRKVEILREHLENGISISELARRYSIHPNMIHNWKKQLFEAMKFIALTFLQSNYHQKNV